MSQIIQVARLCKWLCYHTHDSRRSEPGWPDLAMVRPPELLLVEVKTDVGRLTSSQQMWLSALEQCPGVEVYTWRPRDWSTIVSRLQKRDTPVHDGTSQHQNGQKT